MLNTLRHWGAGFSRIPQVLDMHSDQLSPSTLTKQILLLQSFYYVTAVIACYAVSVLQGLEFSWDWIFHWQNVTLDNSLGVYLIVMWLFDSFMCVLFMTFIVGRSKLAWDFALTVHLIDLAMVSFYSHGIPLSFIWWCVQVSSGLILVSLGTWTSRWRELRDTFFEGLNDAELGQSHELREMH